MSKLNPKDENSFPEATDDWDCEYKPEPFIQMAAFAAETKMPQEKLSETISASKTASTSPPICAAARVAAQLSGSLAYPAAATDAAALPSPIPFKDKPGHYPALFHRSALFGVARADSASTRTGEGVKAQGDYDLVASGPRLTLHDKSVWEALMDIAKEQDHDLAKPLRSSLSEVARRCGAKFTGSRVTKAVSDGIQRMCMTSLTVRLGGAGVVYGRLLAGFTADSHGTSIHFDPGLATALLGADLNFKIDSTRRRRLDTGLAQWLHDFISTHEEGRSLTLGYLRELSGFTANPKRFPTSLKAAMLELKEHAPGLVLGFSITESTRSSDHWPLSIQRGPDAPSFVGYRPPVKHASSIERTGPKRGGVAL